MKKLPKIIKVKRRRMVRKNLSFINILLVDDDKKLCKYTYRFLIKEGCTVTIANDPFKAIEEFNNSVFHVVILDLKLPGMDGLELLKDLKKINENFIAIICTGFPSLGTAVKALELDAVDYLSKPFTPNELLESIRKALYKKNILINQEDKLLKLVGKNIKYIRTRKGMTMRELSRRCGISYSILSHIERAHNSTSISILYRISIALGIDFKDLLNGM